MCCSNLKKDKKDKLDIKDIDLREKKKSISPIHQILEEKTGSILKISKDNKIQSDDLKRWKQTFETECSQIKEELDLARILLTKGADPAIISKNGFSPIHLASYKVFHFKYSVM